MTTMASRPRPAVLAALAALPGLARAYSFTFGSTPTQCQNATINIVGSDGVPPYNIVILAYGNPPGGNESRKIIDYSFNDTTSSVLVAFPSNSQFVAIVSDSTGFGTGGTTLSVNTGDSNDSSCIPTGVQPDFVFYDGDGTLTQCETMGLGYSPSGPQGAVTFYGVIPGGQSFAIPTTGATKSSDGTQMDFNWVVSVPAFTDIMLMAGDERGHGTGGSTGLINVKSGTTECLSTNEHSSTPGTPAGGVYPTDSSGGGSTSTSTSSGKGGGGGTDIGAIVGGVIGALVFVIIVLCGLLFWIWKRRRNHQRNHIKEKPDLTDDPRPLAAALANNDDLRPEPFIVPPSVTSASRPNTPSSATGAAGAQPPSAWVRAHDRRPSNNGSNGARPLSLATTEEGGTSIGGLSAWERKHGAAGGPQLRPVNIIQHDDAGEVDGEPDTVELPPAYGRIRPRATPSPSPAPPELSADTDLPPPAHS